MRLLNGWKVNDECDCERNHSRELFRIGWFMEGSVHWLLPKRIWKNNLRLKKKDMDRWGMPWSVGNQ